MPIAHVNLSRHHTEMARAAAAAMEKAYDDAIEIVSDLLTSGLYEEMAAEGHEDDARLCRAEARLMMGTAMHYADRNYQDIARVLGFALDSPPHIQKDAYFTLAVVHLSFGQAGQAREAMQQCLATIAQLRASGFAASDELDQQESEANAFLLDLPAA